MVNYNKVSEILRIKRMSVLKKILIELDYQSILDIGCRDANVKTILEDGKIYLGLDIDPETDAPYVRKQDFMKLKPKKKYDIVMALQTLEHLSNPVKAITKMKKLSKKYIIISVPYEPIYSLFRLGVPNKEHKFAIYPWTLKEMLGHPIYEKMMVFGRQYFGVWKK
jgi:2-polyprenyl-3-methyl-5-hydroxy-6-metoxy-1,4-benzoquinol methylase